MRIMIQYFQEMWKLTLQGEVQGIWFWLAIYTLLVGIYSLIGQIKTRYWPFVYGEIIDLGVKTLVGSDWDKSNRKYASKTLYTYNVAGVSHEGTRISPWIFVASHNGRFVLEKQLASIQRLPDGKVKVFYNPNNPKKSFLIVANKIGIFITFFIVLLPSLLFYTKYHL